MLNIDYANHNRRSKEIWTAYEAGCPIRVPVTIYADVRNWLAAPGQNPSGVTMSEYLKDADLMLDCQIKASEWIRHNIVSDDGMGYPEDGWSVRVDYQNFLEPVWFGGRVTYGREPHSEAFLSDDAKRSILDTGMPEPFSGINGEVIQRYEYLVEKKRSFTYCGLPLMHVEMPYNMLGTDGPFTIACSLRGADHFILDMLEDSAYACQLLSLITESIIRRIKEVRKYLGICDTIRGFGMADDSIVLLSPHLYREFVLPCHRRIYDALSPEGGSRSVHLCGDAQRFFPVFEEVLGVKSFDTGFPVDFECLYDKLSSDVRIFGGPSTRLIYAGPGEAVKAEAKRILQSGVMQKSKAFVLREGNALAPGTPLEHVNAIYEAAEEYGYY